MRMGMMLMNNNTVPDVDTRTAGVFADYHHSITDRLRLSGGLRFDHASMSVNNQSASTDLYYQYANTRQTSNMDNYPSGNVRMSFALRKSAELFVGVGSTARIPDAEERYISRKSSAGNNAGNPLLPPTRNTEVTAGMNYKHGGSYIKPVLFYSNLNDYIVLNDQPVVNMLPGSPMGGMGGGMGMTPPPTSARSYRNVNARIYGGEVSYALAVNDSLSFSGGTSYSRGIKDPEAQAGIFSSNLAEMPPLRSWLAIRYVYKTSFMEFGGVTVNRQGRIDTDMLETVTPGYYTMNFKIGGSYKKMRGTFVVDNLLNKFYYENLSYYRDPFRSGVKVPEPGRNIFAQVTYRF